MANSCDQVRAATVEKMAAYIQFLSGQSDRSASRVVKLAETLKQTKDLFQAVEQTYRHKSAAYRHQLVQGLVRGFRSKLAAAKRASLMGVSQHPSTKLTGTTGSLHKSMTVPHKPSSPSTSA